MRKADFNICENKVADQLRVNSSAETPMTGFLVKQLIRYGTHFLMVWLTAS